MSNYYSDHPVRRRKRKRRRKSHAGGFIVFLLLMILILTAVGVVLYLRVPKPRKLLLGSWRTQIDQTQETIANAQEWLNEAALGYRIHLADEIRSIPICIDLTLHPNGSYESAVNREIYQTNEEAANEALSVAILRLLSLRAEAVGKEPLTEQDARSLFERAMELTPEEYLQIYGPRLLPDIEELSAQYARKGKFTLEDPDIVWDSERRQHYLVNEELLALDDVLYRRIQTEEDPDRDKTGRLPFNLPSPVLTAKAANHRIIENLPASTTADPESQRIVKSIHFQYQNNRYLSLRDLANLLNDTDRRFSLSIDNNGIEIQTRASYETVGGENEPFDLSEDADLYSTGDLKANSMTVDGRTVKYYTFLGKNTDGKQDCYLNLTDFCLLFDLNVIFEDNGIVIRTDDTPFVIDMDLMKDEGFYDEMISAVVGDAMTGEIFAGDREELAVPIASTTKLMSYAVIMDAITNGEIGPNDTVVISENAAALSQGQDRVIPMTAGQESNVPDLMKAMLIASSNESVLALAEYVAGSEEAFVRRMQEKAAAIGLSDATVFYNCNGLPVFADSVSTAKRQNHMSAVDMFKLAAHILTVYPQITEITTIREDSLTSLHMDIKTTNALLYNEPDVIGLKTGTTNMAGSCLVCAMRTQDASGEEHDVVAVILGAEDNTVRFSSGDVLLRYGRQCVRGGIDGIALKTQEDTIPTDAEGLIRRVLSRY